MELVEFVLVELDAHLTDLLDPHPVLAGDGPSDLHTQLQDLAAQFLGALQLSGVVGVVKDQGVQVAVAGVEDVGHRQSVFLGQFRRAAQYLGQEAAGDGPVHAVVVRGQAAHRGEGGLASLPEAQPLGGVLGGADLCRAACQQKLSHRGDVLGDLGVGPIHLAQEDGRGVSGVAGVDKGLRRLDGRAVHHLQPGGDDPGGDDVPHRRACLLYVVEGGQDHLGPLRDGQQAHRDLNHHPEHALGADEQRQQVVAGRVQRLAADLDQVTLHRDQGNGQDVVYREPVLEAVHPA